MVAEERFGPYRLLGLIGRGGMGEVYRAVDTVKGREVAVKRLPAPLAADQEFQRRFRRESELAARLRNPHVIPIHDYGEIDGRLFLEMLLVDGGDLGNRLAEDGPLPPLHAVGVIGQVAEALDAAHAVGMVHRDIKPSNVLIAQSGGVSNGAELVYLGDFGIARAMAGATSLTVTGATVGTLAYMAPERFLRDGDHRVDVYSLACVLFETLTGRAPFTGEGLPQLMFAHVNLPPPRPSEHSPGIPVCLDEVVARGMAKDPDQRYSTAGKLAAAARTALTTTPSATPIDSVPSGVATTHTTVPPQPMPETIQAAARRADQFSPSAPQRRRLGLASAGLAVAAVGAAVVIVLLGNDVPDPAPPSTPDVPSAPNNTINTIQVGRDPRAIAISPDGRYLYISNQSSSAMSVVDTDTDTVTATIPVGATPFGVAVSPDGRRVYVANDGQGNVAVIDTATNTVIATSESGDNRAIAVAVNPNGRRVYVTTYSGNVVSVIDTARNTVIASIPVVGPSRLAVTPDGRHLYVSSTDDSGRGSTAVVDITTNRVTTTIPAGGDEVSMAPDGHHAYVIGNGDGGASTLSVIDTGTNAVISTISAGYYSYDLAVSTDGRRIYAIDGGYGNLLVIDTAANTVVATIPVPNPEAIALSPDGQRAYVVNDGDPGNPGTVSVIDTT